MVRCQNRFARQFAHCWVHTSDDTRRVLPPRQSPHPRPSTCISHPKQHRICSESPRSPETCCAVNDLIYHMSSRLAAGASAQVLQPACRASTAAAAATGPIWLAANLQLPSPLAAAILSVWQTSLDACTCRPHHRSQKRRQRMGQIHAPPIKWRKGGCCLPSKMLRRMLRASPAACDGARLTAARVLLAATAGNRRCCTTAAALLS